MEENSIIEEDKISEEVESAKEPDEILAADAQTGEETELFRYKKQSEDNLDRALRIQADFENYKKRVAKEREDIFTMSLEKIMKDILPIIDNLERAIASFKVDESASKYTEGVEMVCNQLITMLEKHNLKEIDCEGKEFDPNFHHAVMQCEAGEDDENSIKQVLQKGYLLGGRVIRPAMVQVAVKQ